MRNQPVPLLCVYMYDNCLQSHSNNHTRVIFYYVLEDLTNTRNKYDSVSSEWL